MVMPTDFDKFHYDVVMGLLCLMAINAYGFGMNIVGGFCVFTIFAVLIARIISLYKET